MAKSESGKITRAALLKAMEEKLQALNLLKSALQADQSRKQDVLENYQKQFHELINLKVKKK